VPQDLFDAATIDGAGARRRFRNVTLPMLGPTFAFVVPIAVLNALTQVDHVVTITQGGPADATNLLLYYIYQQAAPNYDVGLASAATVISVAALLALSLTSFHMLERGIHYESCVAPRWTDRRKRGSAGLGGAFAWMAVAALRPGVPADIATLTPPGPFALSNCREAWQSGNFPLWYLNTIIVCGGILAVQLVTVTAAGYAFARLTFPGRDVLFALFLLSANT
jgi:ABC-type glycerol-3-phosphate transport system permease component